MSYEETYNTMSFVLGITTILFITSVATGGLMFWYIRKISDKLKYAILRHTEISEGLNQFVEHIETVNKAELYHGDEVIVNLLKHSRAMAEDIEDYREMIIKEEESDNEDGNNETG